MKHRAVTSFARLACPSAPAILACYRRDARMFSKKTWSTVRLRPCRFACRSAPAILACYRRDASYDLVASLVEECFRGAPRRQAVSVVGVKETWRTLSVSEGQRPESHTKTLMERASSRNQLSPLPKIGEGFGEWSEAPSYEEGVGVDGGIAGKCLQWGLGVSPSAR